VREKGGEEGGEEEREYPKTKNYPQMGRKNSPTKPGKKSRVCPGRKESETRSGRWIISSIDYNLRWNIRENLSYSIVSPSPLDQR